MQGEYHASTFLFGRPGAAEEATLPSVAKTDEAVLVPVIVVVHRRAVGLSAQIKKLMLQFHLPIQMLEREHVAIYDAESEAGVNALAVNVFGINK